MNMKNLDHLLHIKSVFKKNCNSSLNRFENQIHTLQFHFEHLINVSQKTKKYRGVGGIEPPTSRTQNENHTTRPNSLVEELN
jgi:hypothetical protein